MRRPVPKKKAPNAPRKGINEEVENLGTGSSFDRGRAAHEADLAEIAATINLDQLDPRAKLLVITNVVDRESAFTTGDALRQHWESSKVQRVGHYFSDLPIGWSTVTCPDGSRCFIKFTSPEFQLLGEPNHTAGIETQDKPMKNKPTPPPKKNQKLRPGAVPPTKPTSATTAPVKPVKPSGKPEKAPKAIRLPKTTGNYAWLLRRMQAQAVNQLTTPANRASVRDGLSKCEDYLTSKSFLDKANVVDATKFDAFLNVFFAATINR